LQKVDLSSIKAIAHDAVTLQVLIERDRGYCLESLPAPEQAFQGLLQLAQFTTGSFGMNVAIKKVTNESEDT
jgi:hypothetical protein